MNFEARLDICNKDHDPSLRRQNSMRSIIGAYVSLAIVGDIHGTVRPPSAGAKIIALPVINRGDSQMPTVFDLGSELQAVVTVRSDIDVIAELDGEQYYLPSRFRIACLPKLIHLWCEK